MKLIRSKDNIRSVTEINNEIQRLFEQHLLFVRIVGEITNVSRPLSGHLYFSLKDEKSRIKAVLFKNHSRYLAQPLENGQQVICDGKIAVYSPRGDYQIIVESVNFQGSGILQARFHSLKEKLTARGYFDPSLKKPLPSRPQRIIVITSLSGAAIHDFLSIYRKRQSDISLQILPVPVQGKDAAREIAKAIETGCSLKPDIIVLCRGGGSIEDLWAFNEEQLAEVMYRAKTPIVSAIGHETDFTIADFCADVRCATPTAAAELIIPDMIRQKEQIQHLAKRIARSFTWQLESAQHHLGHVEQRLQTYESALESCSIHLDTIAAQINRNMTHLLDHYESLTKALENKIISASPASRLERDQFRLDLLSEKLKSGLRTICTGKEATFKKITAVLDSVSPLATLARGYAIVSRIDQTGTRRVVTDAREVAIDERLDITLKEGQIGCTVTAKEKVELS